MKILIFGMQSSGSTLFNFLLSQKKDTISILDLFCTELSPYIESVYDINLKCVASNNYTLDNHIATYSPDRVIHFKRDIKDTIASLSTKEYAQKCGSIDEKIEEYLSSIKKCKSLIDLEYSYKELINEDLGSLRGLLKIDYFTFPRSINNIIEFNLGKSEWCKANFKKKWYIGGLRTNRRWTSHVDKFQLDSKYKINNAAKGNDVSFL